MRGDKWEYGVRQEFLQTFHNCRCMGHGAVVIVLWVWRFFGTGIMVAVFHSVGIVAVRYDSQKTDSSIGESSMAQVLSSLAGMPSGPAACQAYLLREGDRFLRVWRREGSQYSLAIQPRLGCEVLVVKASVECI